MAARWPRHSHRIPAPSDAVIKPRGGCHQVATYIASLQSAERPANVNKVMARFVLGRVRWVFSRPPTVISGRWRGIRSGPRKIETYQGLAAARWQAVSVPCDAQLLCISMRVPEPTSLRAIAHRV